MLLRLQLQPVNDTLRYHAGQYVEVLLRDGSRRSYSINAPLPVPPVPTASDPTATAPHPRPRWSCTCAMPGGKFTDHVFGAMKKRNPAHRRPYGSFYLRETLTNP